MRDHTKLRAFELADQLALAVYRETARMPAEEKFGLTSQMRRAAVSVASDIVEGCARGSESEYVHFLEMAFGSAHELEYQLSLAARLGLLPPECAARVLPLATEATKVLGGLVRSLKAQTERARPGRSAPA